VSLVPPASSILAVFLIPSGYKVLHHKVSQNLIGQSPNLQSHNQESRSSFIMQVTLPHSPSRGCSQVSSRAAGILRHDWGRTHFQAGCWQTPRPWRVSLHNIAAGFCRLSIQDGSYCFFMT
jgi:hypothetical protein